MSKKYPEFSGLHLPTIEAAILAAWKKEQAFEQLKANAEKLNANAVVGITVDIELTTSNYVTVPVTGTAVSIIKR